MDRQERVFLTIMKSEKPDLESVTTPCAEESVGGGCCESESFAHYGSPSPLYTSKTS